MLAAYTHNHARIKTGENKQKAPWIIIIQHAHEPINAASHKNGGKLRMKSRLHHRDTAHWHQKSAWARTALPKVMSYVVYVFGLHL
jgi:hypothetical protein